MTRALAVPLSAPPERSIAVADLHDLLTGGGEIALLDVREEYDYAQGHILLATVLPLSQLELRIAALVPRRATRIIVTDGDDGELAARAAQRLAELGYADVSVLNGGVAAWRNAGHEVFTTTHVLAKTFGGLAERAYGTPRVTAEQLRARLDNGGDVAIFDSRTFAEFQAGSLPGAQSCPLAELAYRVPDAVRSPDTLVVINCASRTRGILGAQSLANLGLPNPVAVLENGVMAWTLAGGKVVPGSAAIAPEPARVVERQRQAAEHLAQRFDVPLIDLAGLGQLQADDARSLYIFDVRTPEAYEAGHWREARSAPGGQLIMTLPQFVATHRARVVLVDGGDLLRATTTAAWLKQIGRHEAYVLREAAPAGEFETGPARATPLGLPADTRWIEPSVAAAWLEAGRAAVIDVDTSLAYRAGHIPGAYFAIRSRLPSGLTMLTDPALIFTSSDGDLAALAAARVRHRNRIVVALRGGTAAWRAAGLPLEAGDGERLHPFEDVWHSPMRETARRDEAYARYLAWEMSLADQVQRDDTVAFALPPEAGFARKPQ